MNYQKIYDKICSHAKLQNRIKYNGVYYEAHHIIPECMGGEGKTWQWKWHPNIVLLTAKEHYICHLLLFNIYPENDSIIRSFYMMGVSTKSQKRLKIKKGSRHYELAKKLFSQNHHNKIEENRHIISERQRGKKRPKEVGEKVAITLSGKKPSEITRNKMSETRKKLGFWKGDNNPGKIKENNKKASDAVKKKLGFEVIQYDMHGNEIASYRSIREASKNTGIHKNKISLSCKNNVNLSTNYMFKYKIK